MINRLAEIEPDGLARAAGPRRHLLGVDQLELTTIDGLDPPLCLRDSSHFNLLWRKPFAKGIGEDPSDLDPRQAHRGLQGALGFVTHARQCRAIAYRDAKEPIWSRHAVQIFGLMSLGFMIALRDTTCADEKAKPLC